jgi:TonB family protein
VQISEQRDARRLAVAVAAAILVHVGLFFGIPFLTSLDTAPLPDYGPIVVTLEEPAAAFEPPAPQPAPSPAPAVTPAPQPAAQPAQAPKPATTPAATAPAPATPRRASGTSAFRQAGAATGTSAGSAPESIVSGPPPVTLPAVGSSATAGAGEQRAGEAVTLAGVHATASSGSLDTRKLDSSLARTGTSGAPGAAAASGSGTGTAAAAADIEWENPAAAKGRELVSAPLPRLPVWVKELGLDLEVRIAFSVNAEGLVTSPRVVQGSGYPDVDDACLAALRQYRFSTATGAAAIKGSRTFRTKQR